MINLKAFVQLDSSGRVMPGGPVLSNTKPKNGKWVEMVVIADPCCTTTTTTLDPLCRKFRFSGDGRKALWTVVNCAGITVTEGTASPTPWVLERCYRSIISIVGAEYEDIGICTT